MAAGEVETELKFTRGGGGDNAGLLAGVSEPGNGADNFHGYEISLAADVRKVVLGKHKNNFTPIADAAVSCDPAQWNRLGFKTDGRTLQVFLNGACVLRAEDDDPVLARGRVALRTWNSEARFRNVKVTADGASRKLVFRTTPAVQVSRQWDAFRRAVPWLPTATKWGTPITAPARRAWNSSPGREPSASPMPD